MEVVAFEQFITPVIFIICLCVGFVVKNIVPSEKVNRFIPLIVGVLGIWLAAWVNMSITPDVICTGLVSGLASTGAYELFKQFINQVQ